jgi:hypothetical protein
MSNAALRHSVALLLSAVLPMLPLAALAAAAPAPAPTATPAAPIYGDLSHLEFTATGSLTAELVSPEPGGSSDREAATFEVSTVAGAGVELTVDGAIVETKHIGKRTIDKKTGETHYFFYGVALAPGPNEVVLVPLGAGTTAWHAVPHRRVRAGPARARRCEADRRRCAPTAHGLRRSCNSPHSIAGTTGRCRARRCTLRFSKATRTSNRCGIIATAARRRTKPNVSACPWPVRRRPVMDLLRRIVASLRIPRRCRPMRRITRSTAMSTAIPFRRSAQGHDLNSALRRRQQFAIPGARRNAAFARNGLARARARLSCGRSRHSRDDRRHSERNSRVREPGAAQTDGAGPRNGRRRQRARRARRVAGRSRGCQFPQRPRRALRRRPGRENAQSRSPTIRRIRSN